MNGCIKLRGKERKTGLDWTRQKMRGKKHSTETRGLYRRYAGGEIEAINNHNHNNKDNATELYGSVAEEKIPENWIAEERRLDQQNQREIMPATGMQCKAKE